MVLVTSWRRFGSVRKESVDVRKEPHKHAFAKILLCMTVPWQRRQKAVVQAGLILRRTANRVERKKRLRAFFR